MTHWTVIKREREGYRNSRWNGCWGWNRQTRPVKWEQLNEQTLTRHDYSWKRGGEGANTGRQCPWGGGHRWRNERKEEIKPGSAQRQEAAHAPMEQRHRPHFSHRPSHTATNQRIGILSRHRHRRRGDESSLANSHRRGGLSLTDQLSSYSMWWSMPQGARPWCNGLIVLISKI